MADDMSDAVKNSIKSYNDLDENERANFHSELRSNKKWTAAEAMALAKNHGRTDDEEDFASGKIDSLPKKKKKGDAATQEKMYGKDDDGE